MAYILGIFVLGIIITIVASLFQNKEYYAYDPFGFILAGFAMSAFAGFILGGGIAFAVGASKEPAPSTVETYTLEMLNDTKELEGGFFLASGSFNEEAYFYFYKNNGEYSVLDQTPAYRARIVESNETNPRLEESTPEGTYGWWYFKMSEGIYTETFYIPEGSITNNYDLGDLND